MSLGHETEKGMVALSEQTPEELAARAQAGSLGAYGELVRRFQDRVYSFLLRRTLTAADAEDLAQDTFIRAWRRIGLYRPTNRFSTWLFTIAARLASSHRRAAARRAARMPRVEAAGTLDPTTRAVRAERQGRVWATVDRMLRGDQRTIVWLRYAEGLSMKEIAAVLGKTQVGVRVSLFRAREVLAASPELSLEVDRPAPSVPTVRTARARAVAGGVR